MTDSNRRARRERHGRFWFGTGLAEFLAAELKDSPERRIAAARLFAVSLIIATVSQSLHVPPLGALSLLVCLSYDAYANAGQSLAFGLRQLFYLFVTVLISVLALMLAGNDPWLMLSLSFAIMALALFHARLIAWPTGIALWYSIPVLYSPTTPDENLYHALWNIPVIGVLGLGSWTLVHLSIAPRDPRTLLIAGIADQLKAAETIFLGRLSDSEARRPRRASVKPSSIGLFGKLQTLLANSELLHVSIRRRHAAYLELLQEIDGLRQIALWLEQSLTEDYRAQPLTAEKRAVYAALQQACATLRQGFTNRQDLSDGVAALLDDEVLRGYAGTGQPTVLTAFWQALQRIAALMKRLHQPATDSDPAETETEPQTVYPAWLGYEFWRRHADSLQFGIKFSLGAILCMLIVQSLDWPDINTAIPTCLVAAQTSLGADYRLSLLRVGGAALGGACAYVYVWVFQSQFDSIIGFMLATAPFWALAAWITAGSERIAYLGRQLGFSFALFVLHDFGAVEDLFLPRDRVIGILLGLTVMGALDYALWPRRSAALARHHCIAALRTLAKLTVRLPDPGHLMSYTLPLRLAAEKDLAAAQDLLAHAVLEPDARQAGKMRERGVLRAIIRDASNLSALLQVRKRYRLLSGQQFDRFPEALQRHSRDFDAELAKTLAHTADVVAGEKAVDLYDADAIGQLLRQSYIRYHDIGSLPADLAMEWELRFLLDEQILNYLERLQNAASKSFPETSPGFTNR
ncbi:MULTISPECIES: FUSC family protein [unclassified Methylomonas]|uniref:FUSC family protein n=1 Tax=unclassified Methylomonas TaxID=2608980 RepID=UPI00247AD829|nr:MULTISPECIES: FUSC family protein [unclassified Methylomonas]MDT4328290.1 FUSC family protein [Methylomonas sp. MV1]WGS88392.1 FUSC family protein [Methylomonas sp. UP202]